MLNLVNREETAAKSFQRQAWERVADDTAFYVLKEGEIRQYAASHEKIKTQLLFVKN